jgi:hypothetical protein
MLFIFFSNRGIKLRPGLLGDSCPGMLFSLQTYHIHLSFITTMIAFYTISILDRGSSQKLDLSGITNG